MKYFVIYKEDDPVAVVFHDHAAQTLYCRSTVTSFLSAFDAMCAKSEVSFEKDDQGILRAIREGVEGYDWAQKILDQLCTGFWTLGAEGNAINVDSEINSVIQKYLS